VDEIVPTQPGRNGGTLRRGGPGRPRRLPDEFFKLFREGDEKLGLKPRAERLTTLLTCDDLNVRARIEQLLLEHEVGKPVQAIDHSGSIETEASPETINFILASLGHGTKVELDGPVN